MHCMFDIKSRCMKHGNSQPHLMKETDWAWSAQWQDCGGSYLASHVVLNLIWRFEVLTQSLLTIQLLCDVPLLFSEWVLTFWRITVLSSSWSSIKELLVQWQSATSQKTCMFIAVVRTVHSSSYIIKGKNPECWYCTSTHVVGLVEKVHVAWRDSLVKNNFDSSLRHAPWRFQSWNWQLDHML